MPHRSRARVTPRRTAPLLPSQSLPGLAICLILPALTYAAAQFIESRFQWPLPAALLAAGAGAFVPAVLALVFIGRWSGRSRPGAPAPSVEREKLAALTAGDIARPLEDLVCAPADASPEEVLALMRRSGRRWIPLFEEHLDRMASAVPLRHLVLQQDPGAPSRALALPMRRFHTDIEALAVLETMPSGSPPALVEAEGRVIGFLTRHDVAEAAVGALPCGAMTERPVWLARGAGAVVSGIVPVAEIRRRLLGLPGGEAAGALAEALRARLGRALGPGESMEWDGLRFWVEEFVAHEPARFRIERMGKGR